MRMMRESLVLITIGLLDMLSTVVFVTHHEAIEGNPIMAYYLRFGIGAFVLAKLTLLFPPVFIAEWCQRYRPAFTKLVMKGAIAVYVVAYIAVLVTVNTDTKTASVAMPPAQVEMADDAK